MKIYNIIILSFLLLFLTNCDEEQPNDKYEVEHRIFDTMSIKAKELLANNKFNEAEIIFDKFNNTDTFNYSYLVLGGTIKLAARKPGDAITFLSKAINLKPTDELYYHLGEAYMGVNQEENSLICINEAIKLNPNVASYYKIRADFYYRQKVYLMAIDDISLALAVANKNEKSDLYARRASYKYTINDINGTLTDCDSAIMVDKNYFVPYINKACYLIELKRNKEAVKTVDAAIKLGCTHSSAYYRRALAKYYSGDKDCLQDFKKAIELKDEEAIDYVDHCPDKALKEILLGYKRNVL